jgi:hypothetical protein
MADKLPVTVVAATKRSVGGNGDYPSRYVVLKWDKGSSAHEYSRHMQVFDGKSDQYFIYGHYFMTFEDALVDMVESLKKNNESYPEGNVSYFPGMDFVDCG